MKLYFSPGACSLASHIALNEAGLGFDRVKVDLRAKTTEAGEDFRAVSAKGYVPALELDGGEVLTENIAVLSYIGSQAPALFPADGMAHWRVLEALAFISTELHKNFKPFFNPAATDADRDEARKTLSQRFALIEPLLGGGAVGGDQLTVADCYLFVTLFWASEKVKLDLPAPLADHYRRLRQHPAVAKALAAEGLG